MGENPDGARAPKSDGLSRAPHPAADALREQQAIAAAMLIGEEVRRADRKHTYWLVKRLGFFAGALSIFGLLILFAYSRVREEFSPTFWMLVIGAVGAAGVVAAYWAWAEDRRQ